MSPIHEMLDQLHRLGGQPDGGVTRLVYSRPWADARDAIASWMADAGLDARVDAVGNVWGLLEGEESGPPIAAGSHFDSVPSGGKFDGPLGVVAAIAALGTLRREHGRPRRSLAALAICEEEGSRFSAGFWGSRAILGKIESDEPERHRDAGGTVLRDAMRAVGLDPARIAEARAELSGFLELHVEQGPVLAEDGGRGLIGVVTAVTGLARLYVTLEGQPDHAGTTPMTRRRDALLGLAEIALGLRQQALAAGHPAVLTVGRVELAPNAANVVPGRAAFTIDVRHPEDATLRALVDEAAALCDLVAGARGLGVTVERRRLQPPVQMAPELVATVRDSARALGFRTLDMVSGAGHDAQALGTRFPTAMLFVPSRGGRSHCPDEYSSPEDCANGAAVLTETLRRLAY